MSDASNNSVTLDGDNSTTETLTNSELSMELNFNAVALVRGTSITFDNLTITSTIGNRILTITTPEIIVRRASDGTLSVSETSSPASKLLNLSGTTSGNSSFTSVNVPDGLTTYSNNKIQISLTRINSKLSTLSDFQIKKPETSDSPSNKYEFRVTGAGAGNFTEFTDNLTISHQ